MTSRSQRIAVHEDARAQTRTGTPLRGRDFKLFGRNLAPNTKPHHARNKAQIARRIGAGTGDSGDNRQPLRDCSLVCEGTTGGQSA
jgi:hypothetical protein